MPGAGEILILWVIFSILDLAVWSVGRFLNFLADQFIRRNGWDEAEEWVPMEDYYPVWRLIKGVRDMPSRQHRRQI